LDFGTNISTVFADTNTMCNIQIFNVRSKINNYAAKFIAWHQKLKINKTSKLTRCSAAAEITRVTRCVWCHSRSLKVIRCYANRRGIYHFLLALNSNLST